MRQPLVENSRRRGLQPTTARARLGARGRERNGALEWQLLDHGLSSSTETRGETDRAKDARRIEVDIATARPLRAARRRCAKRSVGRTPARASASSTAQLYGNAYALDIARRDDGFGAELTISYRPYNVA